MWNFHFLFFWSFLDLKKNFPWNTWSVNGKRIDWQQLLCKPLFRDNLYEFIYWMNLSISLHNWIQSRCQLWVRYWHVCLSCVANVFRYKRKIRMAKLSQKVRDKIFYSNLKLVMCTCATVHFTRKCVTSAEPIW